VLHIPEKSESQPRDRAHISVDAEFACQPWASLKFMNVYKNGRGNKAAAATSAAAVELNIIHTSSTFLFFH
jgi:hypothetical protein